MSRAALVGQLWAGVLLGVVTDVGAATVTLTIRHADDTDELKDSVVELRGVTSLTVVRDASRDWTYVETTEVGVWRTEDGDFQFEVMFWNEPNSLVVRCSEFLLNGDVALGSE